MKEKLHELFLGGPKSAVFSCARKWPVAYLPYGHGGHGPGACWHSLLLYRPNPL